MKLLSASAVVAGANSVALADCGLCGDKTYDHGTDACPHFDYRGYGLSKGYKPETLPDNEFLGKLALADRKNADAFLNIPTSNASSLDNTWSNTETTIQSSNEKPGASDKLNALKFERTQDLEDSATMVSESDSEEMAELNRRAEIHETRKADRVQNITAGMVAEQTRGEDLQRLFNEENARKEEAAIAQKKAGRRTRAKRLGERAQNNIARRDAERTSGRDLQNLFDEDNARKEEARIAKTKEARARDSEELQGMLKDYRGKSRDAIDLKARDLHLQAHLKRNENARKKELRAQENAAEKIQNARRAQLARRKADLLRKQEETRKDNAALKITEALRKNKERKEAQRQAQINGDYELAKKLQAEYDAEDAQIRADRLLAEQEQLRENLKAVPVEEAQNGEDFKYESEEAQSNSDSILAAQERTSVATSAGDTDEEVETASWTIPPFVRDAFRGYDLEYNRNRADRWARGLNRLSIRELEAMLWLVAVPCKQMMNEGIRMEENIAEAVTAVDGIFPYSGTSAAILNVYNAFEHTETAEFSGGLERLGINELNAVLYYIADQYMHRLMSGKKAASNAFIQLAKAAFECFDAVWEADNAQVASDVSSEKTSDKNVGANAIVENEKPETEEWDLPYRVYYAYCHEIPSNLRPTRVSMKYHTKPALFRNVLRQLSIRQLEAIIYKAVTWYVTTLQKSGESDSGIIEPAKEVGNLFMEVGKDNSNPRLVNVYNAFTNANDHPNDNPISRQPFERGFKELTAEEQRNALLDIFSVYGADIINGSRPAHPAFVRFAAEFCKACNSDVFANVPLTFEEFGSDAVTAVHADKKDMPSDGIKEDEAPETSDWYYPSGLMDGMDYNEEGIYSGRGFVNAFKGLSVRRQEVMLYLAASYYRVKAGANNAMREGANAVFDIFPDSTLRKDANARVHNVYNALQHASEAPDALGFIYSFRTLGINSMHEALGDMASEYREKLRSGRRPADMAFVEFANAICRELRLDGFSFDKRDTNPLQKFEEFGDVADATIASQEIHVRSAAIGTVDEPAIDGWEMPKGVYRALVFRYEGYYQNPDRETSNEGQGRDRVYATLNRLNVRQLEAVLVTVAKVYMQQVATKGGATFGAITEQAPEIVHRVTSAENGDNVRLVNVLETLRKASGKADFESDIGQFEIRQLEGFLGMVAEAYGEKLKGGAVPADEALLMFGKTICEEMYLEWEVPETSAVR